MANERGKSLDKTHLSVDNAEARGFIHRDYIAHCLRWSHVIKHLQGHQLYKTANILDIGCGKEVPLAKTMYSSRLIPTTGSYTGVDANKLEMPAMLSSGKFPIRLFSGMVFNRQSAAWLLQKAALETGFDVITCFEVVEHVEPQGALEILLGIRAALGLGGRAFISTPVFDPHVGAAANHVNEMSYLGMEWLLQYAGLSIQNVWGTFASIRDYEGLLGTEGPIGPLFDKLRAYYDVNYLATVFAPLFPKQSRNCLWEVTQTGTLGKGGNLEGALALANHNNSSSKLWTGFIEAQCVSET